MERYEFDMVPIPSDMLKQLGISRQTTVEAFLDGDRIIVQKAEENFCESYNEDCEGCPYCCPTCGECLKEQIDEHRNEVNGIA